LGFVGEIDSLVKKKGRFLKKAPQKLFYGATPNSRRDRADSALIRANCVAPRLAAQHITIFSPF